MKELDNYKNIVYTIIGCAMKVYNELNFGLFESIYQEALSLELEELGLKYECEKEINVCYKGKPLNKKFRLDIIIGDIICELKSVSEITTAHRSQICNYLRITKKPIGLLINFGGSKLICERWIYDEKTNNCEIVDINLRPIQDNILCEID